MTQRIPKVFAPIHGIIIFVHHSVQPFRFTHWQIQSVSFEVPRFSCPTLYGRKALFCAQLYSNQVVFREKKQALVFALIINSGIVCNDMAAPTETNNATTMLGISEHTQRHRVFWGFRNLMFTPRPKVPLSLTAIIASWFTRFHVHTLRKYFAERANRSGPCKLEAFVMRTGRNMVKSGLVFASSRT